MTDLLIDEDYRRWEVAETGVRGMTTRVTRERLNYRDLLSLLMAIQQETRKKFTADFTAMQIALQCAVAIRLLVCSTPHMGTFFAAPKEAVKAVELAAELIQIQLKWNPFPLAMRDAIFTTVNERLVGCKGDRMENACTVLLGVNTALLLMLAGIEETQKN